MGTTRHDLATRLLHMAVALSVIWQLGVSLVMHKPRGARPGDVFFATHSYVGVATLGLLAVFWLLVLLRRQGTALGALVPWLSSARRHAAWADAKAHAAALLRLRMPGHQAGSALASAVHGLGLLLMSAIAATGAAWWFVQPSTTARVFEDVHKALANLAWAYLVAHASLAVIHHLRGEDVLSAMWSLRSAR
jgi:cytochrome b561